ncbi:MAG: adenine phosphoribosyltransferase [bacterium]|nr:adenine phosphoribosyltransferase [bacterium]
MKDLEKFIRNVQDFPKKGIGFKDITTLLKEGPAFREAVHQMIEPFKNDGIQKIAGIESRGFILGGAMAYEMGIGFIPFRKPGKLPAAKIAESYALEYGTDSIEMHVDSVQKGERVLVVDDLLATGGTAAAACKLVEKLGGVVAGVSFLIELSFIPGREKLKGRKISVLIDYKSE